MSGAFRFLQAIPDTVNKIDPIAKFGSQALAKVDPGGNALGVYGSNAPKPLFGDKVAEGMGIYGNDTAEYDRQTMDNARVTAIQQGETDFEAVNTRTRKMLASEPGHGRTTAQTLLGG